MILIRIAAGPLGGSVGTCGTAPAGYGADPPYMPTARRAPAIPPFVAGGIEGVRSNSYINSY